MKYYQIWLGNQIPAEYADCMTATRLVIEHFGHDYELIHIAGFFGTTMEAAIFKDRIQLAMCCFQDCAWVDCDIILKSIFIPPPGHPAFIYEWGSPRVGYYIVNGFQQFFIDLMAEKETRGIQNVHGYPNKLLRNKTPTEIPKNTFEHLRLMTGKRGYF